MYFCYSYYMDVGGRSGKPLDMVFQRNHEDALEGNIGFMALRCNSRVRKIWQVVKEVLRKTFMGEKSPIQGGDQRVVNKLIHNPGLLDTASELRWGLLPPEVCTQVSHRARAGEGSGMFDNTDLLMYHGNMGGHFNSTKVKLLRY